MSERAAEQAEKKQQLMVPAESGIESEQYGYSDEERYSYSEDEG